MSLKGTERDIPLKAIPKIRKAIAKKDGYALTKYYESGELPKDIYEHLMQQEGFVKRKKKKWWLF